MKRAGARLFLFLHVGTARLFHLCDSQGHSRRRGTEMMATLRQPPKHARTNSDIERERAREWNLRSLEAELEAQATWRQGVAESLQHRLDEQIAENQRLRAENAALKAKKRDDEVETTWEMRSLQAELDSQAAWAQSVSDTLQRRLDDMSAECNSLRAENAALKAATRDDAASQEWKMRSLEAELDAQAQWRQRVAEDLQRRLDEKTRECDELRAEFASSTRR